MKKYIPKGNILCIVTCLAFALATLDYLVRTFTLGCTESAICQFTVIFSPTVYLVLFTLILFEFRPLVLRQSKRSKNIAAVLVFLYSAFLLTQVFLRKQGVGSASYSIVSPLFISGLPLSILTYLLFFRKVRDVLSSYLICFVAVLWFVMPVGIDTLYISQGGYRGTATFQLAVISTSFDLIQYIAAFGLFVAFITAFVAIIIGSYRAIKAKGVERTYSLAVGLSIFTLSIQFINWGGFVWD